MLDELIYRNYSCLGDKLLHPFNEMVDYYHIKYAIVKVVHPMSTLEIGVRHNTLEIGVRHNYSPTTCLKASENITYLEKDNDLDTFRGNKKAGNRIKGITKNYNEKFLISNNQLMNSSIKCKCLCTGFKVKGVEI